LFSRQALDGALLNFIFTNKIDTIRLTWQAFPILN
jgi:hypothetical protein